MNRQQVYGSWAPPLATWSRWVKPALFSQLPQLGELPQPLFEAARPQRAFDALWAARADGGAGIVIDIPGADAVALGLVLARLGYRPIPVFNGLAPPPGVVPLVEVHPIMQALVDAAEELASRQLPDHAPPAFLLDSDRRANDLLAAPGMFDNRSISLPGDFPSGQYLFSKGIRRIVLVQQAGSAPARDLAHALARWQDAGIAFAVKELATPGDPRPTVLKRPSTLALVWDHFVSYVGLRRRGYGFGGIVPYPSSG